MSKYTKRLAFHLAITDREGVAEALYGLYGGDGMKAQADLTTKGLIEKDHEDTCEENFVAPDGFLRSVHEEQVAREDQWLTYADSMIRLRGGENDKEI